MKKIPLKMLITLAMLAALNIVLSRFCSISTQISKISLSFLTVACAAYLYGPLPAAVVAAVADFVGAILVPTGAYFAGFTLSAFISGLILGAVLSRGTSNAMVAAACVADRVVTTLLLNSLWISILYGTPFKALIITRAVQCAVMAVVQYIGITLLLRILPRIKGAAL